jgi:hypothetical protein
MTFAPPPALPPLSRRLLLCSGGGATLLAALSPALRRALADAPRRDDALDEARREAIRWGCAYIAGRQRQDGGFGNNKAVVAITSLCVLALMADGSTDGRGEYGKQVRLGLDFLLRLVEQKVESGARHRYPVGYFLFEQDNNSKMHGQGYATLALATALGTSTGERYRQIRTVLGHAVECIQQAQTDSGGFGYEPEGNKDHEGSVTVTVAQGLRAARDAGLLIDMNVVNRGLRYLKKSQKADGSFKYSLYVDRSSYALTAAALSSFFLYGKYEDDPERTIQRGLDYMMDRLDAVTQSRQWWYYGNFYAAWTCWQKDGDRGEGSSYWARWRQKVYPRILAEQRRSDGSWSDEYDRFDFGPLLPTAFAVLTLAVPDEVLPIFQR